MKREVIMRMLEETFVLKQTNNAGRIGRIGSNRLMTKKENQVRPEEAGILLVVLGIWIGAILLFYSRSISRPCNTMRSSFFTHYSRMAQHSLKFNVIGGRSSAESNHSPRTMSPRYKSSLWPRCKICILRDFKH